MSMDLFLESHSDNVISLKNKCKIIEELLNVLQSLNKKRIVHCNLNPQNIFINNNFEIMIQDFRWSLVIDL
jgi:serine/threonine protein kinase